MADIRGAVRVEGEAGAVYTLAFPTNSICALEERTNESALTLFARLDGTAPIRFTDLRLIVWAGMIAHHPEITEDGAGAAIDAVGVAGMVEALGQAITAAFPAETGPNPRKGRRAAA